MDNKFTTTELHEIFLAALDEKVKIYSDIHEKPLMVELCHPFPLKLKVYLFNITNPPGGRQAGECKCQIILPGQKRGEKGHIDLEPDCMTLLIGFCTVTSNINDGVFVIWDCNMHRTPAFSANIQVHISSLLEALTRGVFSQKKRGNGEVIVLSTPNYLLDAIKMRFEIDCEKLMGDD